MQRSWGGSKVTVAVRGRVTAGMLPAGSPSSRQGAAAAGMPELPERCPASPAQPHPWELPPRELCLHPQPSPLPEGGTRPHEQGNHWPFLPSTPSVSGCSLSPPQEQPGGPGWCLWLFSAHPSPTQRSPARSWFGLLTHPAALSLPGWPSPAPQSRAPRPAPGKPSRWALGQPQANPAAGPQAAPHQDQQRGGSRSPWAQEGLMLHRVWPAPRAEGQQLTWLCLGLFVTKPAYKN